MTTDRTPTSVAIVGCGNIASEYATSLNASDEVSLVGVFDLDDERAAVFAAEHESRAFASMEELLGSDAEIVVNLTIHHAHFDVTSQIIEAGKHVYSEKPVALTSDDAHRLVAMAEAAGVHLACSPFTWLGSSQLRVLDEIRSGRLGTVRVAYAEVNHGRIETWHPNPQPFYDVGVVSDVGVYPLTLLTAFFGPVTRVQSTGRVLLGDRVTLDGVEYTVDAPDFIVTILDLADGPTVRLTTSFYVTSSTATQGIEFHGDRGSIRLGSWSTPEAMVEYADFGESYTIEVAQPDEDWDVSWGFGVIDMVRRLQEGLGPRTTGAHAAHIVDVIEAIEQSQQTNRPVVVDTTFAPPV